MPRKFKIISNACYMNQLKQDTFLTRGFAQRGHIKPSKQIGVSAHDRV